MGSPKTIPIGPKPPAEPVSVVGDLVLLVRILTDALAGQALGSMPSKDELAESHKIRERLRKAADLDV